MANSSTPTLDVLDPATLSRIDAVPLFAVDDLDRAAARAGAARNEWSGSLGVRRKYLHVISELIAAQTDHLAGILTSEQGKPLAQARLEIGVAARAFAHFADLDLAPEVLRDDANGTVLRTFHPIGIAGLLTAWNFPAALLAWKVAPALAAGNACLVKPAPTTPLTALAFAEILREVLPEGLVQVLVGDAELGHALVTHPAIEKISFTGSTPTGRSIMRGGADRLKRLTLELGGNDAAVILPDVDVESAVRGIAAVAFRNAGQVCIAPKRVLVPDGLESEVVEAFTTYLGEQVVGEGLDAATTIGPVNNEPQRDRLVALERSIEDDGGCSHRAAQDRTGDLDGYFVQPAVVSGLRPDARLVREEQFGPMLPVLTYSSIDGAVALANDTEFGLGGSVWGSDVDAATVVADRLRAGTRWVNQHGPAELDVPFGGVAQSGIGVELGREGLLGFTEQRITNIRS